MMSDDGTHGTTRERRKYKPTFQQDLRNATAREALTRFLKKRQGRTATSIDDFRTKFIAWLRRLEPGEFESRFYEPARRRTVEKRRLPQRGVIDVTTVDIIAISALDLMHRVREIVRDSVHGSDIAIEFEPSSLINDYTRAVSSA